MPRGGPRINSGGAREGAGRPADSGWKTTTTEWRASAAAHANELVGSDRDPLLFLIDRVFDDAVDLQSRIGCAAIATKYLHPTLSASQVNAHHVVTRLDVGELLGRVAERIAKQATAELTIEAEPVEPTEQPAETAE
jgi:hypothetical protein